MARARERRPRASPRRGRAAATAARSGRRAATASSTSCVTSSTVRGSRSSASASQRCICARVSASSAPNGSSRHSTGRPASSVRRNATRWRMPPDSSRGRARSNPSSPKRGEVLVRGGARGGLRSRRRRAAPARRCRARVSHGSSPSRCGISAAGVRGRRCRRRARSSPHTSSSSVDLPQPLGPTTATTSRGAARDTPSSAHGAERISRRRQDSVCNVRGSAPEPRPRSASLPPRALPHRFEGSGPARTYLSRALSPAPLVSTALSVSVLPSPSKQPEDRPRAQSQVGRVSAFTKSSSWRVVQHS